MRIIKWYGVRILLFSVFFIRIILKLNHWQCFFLCDMNSLTIADMLVDVVLVVAMHVVVDDHDLSGADVVEQAASASLRDNGAPLR